MGIDYMVGFILLFLYEFIAHFLLLLLLNYLYPIFVFVFVLLLFDCLYVYLFVSNYLPVVLL